MRQTPAEKLGGAQEGGATLTMLTSKQEATESKVNELERLIKLNVPTEVLLEKLGAIKEGTAQERQLANEMREAAAPVANVSTAVADPPSEPGTSRSGGPASTRTKPPEGKEGQPYDPATLGGNPVGRGKHLATLCDRWNEDIVDQLLSCEAPPPLVKITRMVKEEHYNNFQCVFLDHRGRLVPNIWVAECFVTHFYKEKYAEFLRQPRSE